MRLNGRVYAQNLIEILESCAANAGVSTEELEVAFEDSNGFVLPIGGYKIDNPFLGEDDTIFCILKEGDEW